jgi:hypothetical protein
MERGKDVFEYPPKKEFDARGLIQRDLGEDDF